MGGVDVSEQADTHPRAGLFWGVIQSLVEAQMQERPQTPIDLALAYLEKRLDRQPEKDRPHLERLIADMRGFSGLGGGTITELFERHQESLSRSLLLFCLREHCIDLLEFSHPLLNGAEYLVAGILFGVRDGWLGLPKELRNQDLSAYVSFRMADAEWRKRDESLDMNAPPRPKPLRELFTSPSGEWSKKRREVAEELASQCDWNDCFETHITLAGGENLPQSFERKGLHLVLPGKSQAIDVKVNEAKFLHRLGQWPPIAPQIESEVRKRLASLEASEEKGNGDG